MIRVRASSDVLDFQNIRHNFHIVDAIFVGYHRMNFSTEVKLRAWAWFYHVRGSVRLDSAVLCYKVKGKPIY